MVLQKANKNDINVVARLFNMFVGWFNAVVGETLLGTKTFGHSGRDCDAKSIDKNLWIIPTLSAIFFMPCQ